MNSKLAWTLPYKEIRHSGNAKYRSTDAYHTLFRPLCMHSRKLADGILLIEKHSISFQFCKNWKEMKGLFYWNYCALSGYLLCKAGARHWVYPIHFCMFSKPLVRELFRWWRWTRNVFLTRPTPCTTPFVYKIQIFPNNEAFSIFYCYLCRMPNCVVITTCRIYN